MVNKMPEREDEEIHPAWWVALGAIVGAAIYALYYFFTHQSKKQ